MKKLSLILICLLAGAFLLGCESKQPTPPDLPVVTPSQDDPNLMICDSAVPKPDRIVVFDAGSERTIEPDSEEFEDIWLAVHKIANGGDVDGLDCILTNFRVEEYKKTDPGIEFWYDHTYTLEKTSFFFNGMFFEFDPTYLVLSYFTVDQKGNPPLPDADGFVCYSSCYGVYAPDLTEDLKMLLFS